MITSRRSRILYVNHTGHVSGAERVLINTLRTLDQRRFEPIVACPSYGGLAEEVDRLGVKSIPMPLIQARFAWRPDKLLLSVSTIADAVRALRDTIRTVGPHLIHANSVRAGIVSTLAAAGTRTPVIWHVHDILPQHLLSTGVRSLVFCARHTHVIAVSNATGRRFRGHFPIAGKIRIIHNGIELDQFAGSTSSRRVFREKLGLSDEDFLVCAIGQICERKGLLGLVDAVRRSLAEVPNIHLAIVGRVVFQHEAGYLDNLLDAVRAWGIEDHVHFYGEVRDVPGVLHSSDLMVLNSRDEPFGLVVVEAMASGTPVLATRVGGIPEIIEETSNGWLVEPGDSSELAVRLVELSENRSELRRVAERALHITCPKFSLDRYKGELESLYVALESRAHRDRHQFGIPLPLKSGSH